MAYPMEKQHEEYQRYVIEAQSNGETPLSIEEWMKKMKGEMMNGGMKSEKKKGMTTAMSNY